jgi:orotidine-5'-phosphate decarboxylase
MTGHFGDRLAAHVAATGSALCVGIDPRTPLPDECTRGLADSRSGLARAFERYGVAIVEAVAPHAAAVKPQVAFFEALGGYGLAALDAVSAAAREHGLLVVADAKRGDIGSTAEAYAAAWLLPRGAGEAPAADALTVNPYLGADAAAPFLAACDAAGGGLFVLARTSNPGGADLQELELADGGRVWERVATAIDSWGAGRVGASGLSSIGAVVGLTRPDAIARARELMPRAPLLLPGWGAQGGGLAAAAPAFRFHPAGGLLVAARSIVEAWRGEPGDWRAAVGEAARAHGHAARDLSNRAAG